MTVEDPYAVAMIPCDHVHVDPQTGKLYLMGPFFEASVESVPFTFGAIALYVVLTNARGPHIASVSILDPDDEELPDLAQEIALDFSDEKQRFQFFFSFENVVFDQAGEHLFVLRLSGEIVGTCRLNIILFEGQ
jgi:hypothetical protein